MSQYSDSFQVFVKADCVIHKTIIVTANRRPRIPFITYLLFQTAHPKPHDPLESGFFYMVPGRPNRWLTVSLGFISYHLDSVKPKIMKKHVFLTFSGFGSSDQRKALWLVRTVVGFTFYLIPYGKWHFSYSARSKRRNKLINLTCCSLQNNKF